MVVEPNCRVGHGLLVKQLSTYLLRKTAGIFQTDENGRRYIVPSGTSFAVTLWRCPVCAYLEVFDPDEMATDDGKAEDVQEEFEPAGFAQPSASQYGGSPKASRRQLTSARSLADARRPSG